MSKAYSQLIYSRLVPNFLLSENDLSDQGVNQKNCCALVMTKKPTMK